MFSIRARFALAVVLALTACHGSHNNGSGSQSQSAPTRGQLLGTPTKTGSFSPSDLLSQLTGDPLGKELLQLTFSPTCTVDVYHMQYQTVGGANESTTASSALMIPSGTNGSC